MKVVLNIYAEVLDIQVATNECRKMIFRISHRQEALSRQARFEPMKQLVTRRLKPIRLLQQEDVRIKIFDYTGNVIEAAYVAFILPTGQHIPGHDSQRKRLAAHSSSSKRQPYI
jgi:hypothetical protein